LVNTIKHIFAIRICLLVDLTKELIEKRIIESMEKPSMVE